MHLKAILSICVLSLLLSPTGAAQGGLSLKDRIKSSIKERETAWELNSDMEVTPDESSSVIVLTWRRDKASVGAVLLTYESKKSALDVYRGVERDHIFAGISMNVLKDESLAVGEERFAWADAHSPNTKGVTFVRGRTFVRVDTQDLSLAKQFAEAIDTQILRK